MSTGKYRTEHNCLNCGHHVEEHFCTHCGQENIEVKEDALHMISHAVADYFHFESKFFGTISPLLLKPGLLTKQYVAGKRVSFIHPIRLYIFISIVFFLITLRSDKHESAVKQDSKQTSTAKLDSIASKRAKMLKEVLADKPIPQSLKDSLIQATVNDIKNGPKGKEKSKILKFNSAWIKITDTTFTAYENRQKLLPVSKKDNFVKQYIIRRIFELSAYPDSRERMKEEIMHNIPKMMFILLPLFALILKLVYINKKKYYYEHLIYSFHVHSALFLSYLFLVLLKWATGFVFDLEGWFTFLWMVYILWYIYRSLRTFYGSRRWVTVLKIFFLMFCYSIVFTVSTLLIIAVSVMAI